MLELTTEQFQKKFDAYDKRDWEPLKRDINKIYFAFVDDVYITLDVLNEVYVEEFKTSEEMHRYYQTPEQQLTLFEYTHNKDKEDNDA